MIKPYLMAFVVLMAVGLAEAGGAMGLAAGARLEQADRLARQGQIDAALTVYRELSDSQPDSARVHARVGGMLLLKQDYADAVRSFQTAIGLDSEHNAEAFIGLGIAYLHQGKYGPARAALAQARRLRPDSAADVDQLMAWLDGRTSGPEGNHR